MRGGAEEFTKTFPGSIFGTLDVYSGDGWQVLMPGRKRSLRAALFLRAMIIRASHDQRLDTRISVAWGGVDASSLDPERISQSTGEAFTKSGRALKGLKKPRRLVWTPDDSSLQNCFFLSAINLLDELVQRWTQRQAQTISLALLKLRQEEIATAIGNRQPTVHQSLHSAGWRGINDFLNEFENRF